MELTLRLGQTLCTSPEQLAPGPDHDPVGRAGTVPREVQGTLVPLFTSASHEVTVDTPVSGQVPEILPRVLG